MNNHNDTDTPVSTLEGAETSDSLSSSSSGMVVTNVKLIYQLGSMGIVAPECDPRVNNIFDDVLQAIHGN